MPWRIPRRTKVSTDPVTSYLDGSYLMDEWQRKTGDPDIKRSITIRIDPDIIDFFKKDGSRWQTRMNDALREWMIAKTSVLE
jgi:uncharacterized protein (DUF4415 family)